MKLLEDRAKAWLRARELPVPQGRAAATPDESAAIARELGGRVAVKALVGAGAAARGGRGRSEGGDAAAAAAQAILGMEVGRPAPSGCAWKRRSDRRGLYLSFGFSRLAPQVIVSASRWR
jgi:succinyl-CoA synthetase beta subunit